MKKLSQSQSNRPFELTSPYPPAGDQQKVIDAVVKSIQNGGKEQTILGVTGSGKTYMMASVVNEVQRPTLVIAHNKTLAAQLAEEFGRFFPNNAVHYFVSYYDYYQPESYLPTSDTYIEKQTEINEEIEKLRNAATQALLTRRDVLIVASVSCIYGLGDPSDFEELALKMEVGQEYNFSKLARRLTDLQFSRNQTELKRGSFRIQGDTLELIPAGEECGYRFVFFGDELEEIIKFDKLTNKTLEKVDAYTVFPASQYVTTQDKIKKAIGRIHSDMVDRVTYFEEQGRYLEAQRLKERVLNDIEMLETVGFVGGIENYSVYFDNRQDGEPPSTLLDYFPSDALCFIDESHITIPQIGAMYAGDRSRKESLVNYGFRLPTAFNNRPLRGYEFFQKFNNFTYVSATPGDFELGYGKFPEVVEEENNLSKFNRLKDEILADFVQVKKFEEIYANNEKKKDLLDLGRVESKLAEIFNSKKKNKKELALDVLNSIKFTLELENSLFPKPKRKKKQAIDKSVTRDVTVSEAIIRPTGLLDPEILLRPVKNQVDDILKQVREKVAKGQRVLITTLTKKFAEELDIYLKQLGVKSAYIHSDVEALERLDILADLRRGRYDVLIGINLLREGLDLPEVGLVAIFDADKEGFLRSKTSLIQIIGRAARHSEGQVLMYADTITDSMRQAIDETERRRALQIAYNKKHGITPKSTKRELKTIADEVREENEEFEDIDIQIEFGLDDISLTNLHEREGRHINKQGKKVENRLKFNQGRQVFANFEGQKVVEKKELESKNLSAEQLQKELQKAVKEMNFERAAAIRDLLGEG